MPEKKRDNEGGQLHYPFFCIDVELIPTLGNKPCLNS